MDHNMGSVGLILWLVTASVAVEGIAVPFFDLIEQGAVGDGVANETNVFLETWKKACGHPGSPIILVPSGKTFLLSPLKFQGPCISPIHFQVDGDLIAPSEMWLDEIDEFGQWIEFSWVNGLIIDGRGEINGNGEQWWKSREEHVCSPSPNGLTIVHSDNVTIRDLKFIDSPREHITINYTVNIYISNLTISAPRTSPNTDGIHLESCQHIQIMDSTIGTGDDCISIGNGTFDLNITRIKCGPGHGISIGSLGRDNSKANVGQIRVSDCSFRNTTNGVRIKTWQGRSSGSATKITFERIYFTSVERPIILDQYYCDKKCHTCPNEPSALKVTDISYISMTGSAVGPVAITLNCSKTIGCSGISMQDVDIRSVDGGTMDAYCFNVQRTVFDRVNPPVQCTY